MSTLVDQLKAARTGIKPWERTPKDALIAVGRSLGSERFPEITAVLDSLSLQRQEIEQETPWDGDATDNVHFAQEEIFSTLLASPIPASVIVGGLKSSFRGTRFWISLTLKERPDQSVAPAIQAALLGETDQLNQRMLKEALHACSLAKPTKRKSWLHTLLGR